MAKHSHGLEGVTPPTDILETDEGFLILMDVPGVSQESLTVDVEESDLTVRGVSSYTEACCSLRLMHSEFGAPEYVRHFTLSDFVDREHIKALLKDGVLQLFLPKTKAMQPRRIEIQSR